MSWGVTPVACIGHSIGEYVAACLGEVLTLEDALKLVVLRGKLMDQAPAGAMLAVPLSEAQVTERLGEGLWLSAINAPAACVVSGSPDKVREFAAQLSRDGIEGRPLQTSGAFHSGLMAEVVGPLTQGAALVRHGSPCIPYISNVTGTWADEGVTHPDYWGRHLREPVRFDQGVSQLLDFGARVFVEVGPGHALSTLVRRRTAGAETDPVAAIPTLRHASEAAGEAETITRAVARLWITGTAPDWQAYHAAESRRRVALPTYPFQRQRHWIDPLPSGAVLAPAHAGKNLDLSSWFYVPAWRSSPPAQPAPPSSAESRERWLVFADRDGVAEAIARKLEALGRQVIRVEPGDAFQELRPDRFLLNSALAEDYAALARSLAGGGRAPTHLLHAWSLGDPGPESSSVTEGSRELVRGFYSVFHTLRALATGTHTEPLRGVILTSNVQQVSGTDAVVPEKAALLGIVRVAPQERPNLGLSVIDLEWPLPEGATRGELLDRLADDLLGPVPDGDIAYRGTSRWTHSFEPVRLPPAGTPARLRRGGVYLITGGLGNVGLALANYLARELSARLVLVGRTPLPAASNWDDWLGSHDDIDPTSAVIRRIRSLEEMGAEVHTTAADVADPIRMREVLEEVASRFGALHGVIHAAGAVSGSSFAPLELLTPADCAAQFRPKLDGANVLCDLLSGRALDFCVLTSSLSTVLGGLEFAAYAAANSALDSLAEDQTRRTGTPWISINWDGWHFGSAPLDPGARGAARFALLPEEGMEAFARILGLHRVSRVVVSTGDLAARAHRLAAKPEANEPDRDTLVPSHRRPDLPVSYVAPRDDVESAIAVIWEELLGVAPIGMADDYFELGGDSLIAVQLTFRLTAAFQTPITTQSLFEGPTIGQLAEKVRAARQKRIEDESQLAEVLRMVQGLSDEEVKRFLADGTTGLPGMDGAE
jgi:acyl transferase domain-containing protein